MDHSPPPDGFEKTIRFCCGFVVGGIVLLFIVPQLVSLEARHVWVTTAVGALVSGLLAIRLGDGFYARISDLFRWW